MVAPLIVGKARVTAQTARKTYAATQRPELLRRVRSRERRKERAAVPLSPEAKQKQIANSSRLRGGARILNRSLPTDNTSVERIRAITAGSLILWSTLPFYVPQLLLWVLGLAGVVGESLPVVDFVIPGQELFVLSYIVIAFIGLCSMAYAVVMFNIRGVDCFSGHKSLYLLLCLMGYFVFFINAAPWTLIWVFSVIMNQSPKEEGAQENT